MNKIIKSEALEANLTKTKNVEFSIPDCHIWFLTLSEQYWGIHKRTLDFFNELHHPYSNRKEVVNLLSELAISDFWVYKDTDDKERALAIILEIFHDLLKEKLPAELSKQLVYIYLDFFSKNYDFLVDYESIPLRFLQILDDNLSNNSFSYLSNMGYFKTSLAKAAADKKTQSRVVSFMKKLIHENIIFWESTTDLNRWYNDNKIKISNKQAISIRESGLSLFSNYHNQFEHSHDFESLCKIAYSFSDIIDVFRNKIDELEKTTDQLSFIFYLLHLPGAVYHRVYLLIDLNKAIKRISYELNAGQCIDSMNELFALFEDFRHSHTSFILDSILNLGKEIINTKNKELIRYFENQIIKFGFITPGITYLTNNWELKIDANHVRNIRVWLDLIEYDPEIMKKLLSALIINLRLGGIFIFDTDLFQKDVTKLLNSKISPIYKQIKQLARIFPVYFNEIGAEGILRDVSTKIDEISHRNDKLIHFLRKQIHIEGNNSHIDITLEIIRFWFDLDKKRLELIVPQNVFEIIDIESPWVKGVHEVLTKICDSDKIQLLELLEKKKEDIDILLSEVSHPNKNDVTRVSLIIELYQLLKEKYLFETDDISKILKRYSFIVPEDVKILEELLNQKNNVEALKLIYSFMIKLNEIIFNPEISEGWESIYYKRHIAFGIPSMYGQYREPKFEAMGLTFRLERIASVLVTNIISEINTDYFTAKTLRDIASVLQLLREGLSLDGIYDQGFDSNLKMFEYSLTSGSFNIRQYINIFEFMEGCVKEIIGKYFIRPYEQLLHDIIPQYVETNQTLDKKELKKTIALKSEVFYRELLSSAFLIQTLDNLIGAILNNLRKHISYLSDSEIQSIMTYNQDLVISPLYLETPTLDNQVFIGSKAYYLKKLYLNNFPVPPGFVITTEVFRRVNSILKISSLDAEIDRLIKSHISELERISGLEFGNPHKPLLLSVRSGAAISLPGAMNTFLNVGLNDEITEILSKQPNFGWTSWDCYRRLLQTWGMAFGLDRNDFDQIIINYKKKFNISQKIEFTPQTMKEIAFEYKKLLENNGIRFENEPFLQIKQAIISVFRSWDTPRAKVYRDHMHIANEWGTAVIVQKMILGNIHQESGSGVLFTHDVQDGKNGINLTGDFSFLSQGEDIVAGLIKTLPISENQRKKYYRKSTFSLESAFPDIYRKLKQIATELIETHGF
ncbi:MAG: PEP/pyruvate-binding domain-containing protein, partial [Candidatus Cloacimonetes bacterium]|nr:PEP/pyruvate-binding domain-containing protein [Candidatus Cloacimonadota bacterium]